MFGIIVALIVWGDYHDSQQYRTVILTPPIAHGRMLPAIKRQKVKDFWKALEATLDRAILEFRKRSTLEKVTELRQQHS